MAKFKVGDKVNHFAKGDGFVVKYDIDPKTAYPIKVSFANEHYTFTSEGRLYEEEEVSLRLTGRPFNVGDRVVIGGEKGVITKVYPFNKDVGPTPVRVDMGVDNVWITTDGRAWPGTPIICEHDCEKEESEAVTENNETEKDAADAEYRERDKGVYISPGFAKDWPIEDITVSDAEIQHIAEMQNWRDVARKQDTELIKEQHNYVRMALKLTGFELDKEAAAIITETVKKVFELGGEFSLDTAREVEARVNEMYNDEPNI